MIISYLILTNGFQERISEQIQQLMEIDSLEEASISFAYIVTLDEFYHKDLTFSSETYSAMAYTS